MAGHDLQTVVHRLHRLAYDGVADSASDADLLHRFVVGREADAFELLVWRHGAMVLATCRRILGHGPDAEDAFQATFLALVRQARTVRNSESLGPWLHRVARRTSLHARHRNARRERVELAQPILATVPPEESVGVRETVDEEIDRLPERLRRAVVLCYLEGHTTEDAARMLGVPRGTILSRLSRARDRLRPRFLRRGLAPVVFAGLSGDALGRSLVESAVQNALDLTNGSAALAPSVAALTNGVVRSMVLGKIKITAAGFILAAAIVGTGTVLVSRPGLFAQPPGASKKTEKPAAKKSIDSGAPFDSLLSKDKEQPADEVKRLQGVWKVERITEDGADSKVKQMQWSFGPSSLTVEDELGNTSETMKYSLGTTANVKTIDLSMGDKTMRGIYRFMKDDKDQPVLQVCLTRPRDSRPTNFDAAKGEKNTVFLMTKIEEKDSGAKPANSDLDALKRENQRLLDQLAINAKQQIVFQARAAEFERAAADQRDAAVQERKRAEANMEGMKALQLKFEREIQQKQREIESLRAKIPLDKWDAGWSEIMVHVPGGWGLRILADGSGIYGFGEKFDDFCTFAAGTFSFDKVRRDVLARAKLDSVRGNEYLQIELRRKNEPGKLNVYSSDGTTAISLLQAAHAKSTTPSLELRWAKSPPKVPAPLTQSSAPPSKP